MEVNLFTWLLILLFPLLNYPHNSLLEFLESAILKVGSLVPTASASPRNLLEMQILKPSSTSVIKNPRGWSLAICLFHKLFGDSDVHWSLRAVFYRKLLLIKLLIPWEWYSVIFNLEKKKSIEETTKLLLVWIFRKGIFWLDISNMWLV